MNIFLYALFYLGVLALVAGCVAYLFTTRDQSKGVGSEASLSRATEKEAEKLGGSYQLSELVNLLEQLGAIEAWGVILELGFTTVREDIQMVVKQNEVELCAPSLATDDTDSFRRAVKAAGLEARTGYTEGQYCVDVTGTWSKIASTIICILGSIYGVGASENVRVRIFG